MPTVSTPDSACGVRIVPSPPLDFGVRVRNKQTPLTIDELRGVRNNQTPLTIDELRGVRNNLPLPEVGTNTPQAPTSIPKRRIPDPYSYPGRTKSGIKKDYSYRLNSYLCVVGTDLLNDRYHRQKILSLPTHQDLENQLLEVLSKNARVASDYEAQGLKLLSAITESQASAMANSAAEFLLSAWDENFYTTKAAAGRKGGRKSRRPPKFTQADLDRCAGLSKPQAAALLGCSEYTIANLRRKQRTAQNFEALPPEFQEMLRGL